jgi:hypothetical protein
VDLPFQRDRGELDVEPSLRDLARQDLDIELTQSRKDNLGKLVVV